MLGPPVGQRLAGARRQLGVHLDVLLGDAGAAGGHERHDRARRLTLQPVDERRQLRVGRVAEERAPGLAALLDPAEERVDAAAQPLLARRARRRVGGEAPRQLAGVLVDERLVQRPLGVEVLIDQRLRRTRRLGDVVERRPVISALGEHLLGGGQDAVAALGGAQPAAGSWAVGGHGSSVGCRPWTSRPRASSTGSTTGRWTSAARCWTGWSPRASPTTSCAAPTAAACWSSWPPSARSAAGPGTPRRRWPSSPAPTPCCWRRCAARTGCRCPRPTRWSSPTSTSPARRPRSASRRSA